VSYLHRKSIIHHNIRSSNIIIDDEGVAILAPFRFLQSSYRRGLPGETGFKALTHKSPEECENQESTEKSDQYSLGLVAYEMVLGKQLSDKIRGLSDKFNFIKAPDPDGPFRSSVPPEFAETILRMLQKHPDDRFPTIRHAVAAAFGSSIEDLDEQQVRESYQRCCNNTDFIKEFYNTLFNRCAEVKQIFEQKRIPMTRQYAMLRIYTGHISGLSIRCEFKPA
jgi:serine/threonine protein kinase